MPDRSQNWKVSVNPVWLKTGLGVISFLVGGAATTATLGYRISHNVATVEQVNGMGAKAMQHADDVGDRTLAASKSYTDQAIGPVMNKMENASGKLDLVIQNQNLVQQQLTQIMLGQAAHSGGRK